MILNITYNYLLHNITVMVSKLGTISVVMPVFNGESVIKKSISQADQRLRNLNCSYEIIVVDDGSRDSTRRIVNSLKNSNIRVLSYDVNQGKGFALIMGALNAVSDYVVFMDGDDDIDTRVLRRFISALDNADIVVGSKRHPDSIVDVPVLRQFLSLGFNILVRLMTGIKIRDTQVGFKVFRRDALIDIMKLVSVRKYAFDVEVLTIATMLNKRIAEVPVNIHADALFSVRNIFRMLIDILGIGYRLRIKKWYQKNYRKKIPPKYQPIIRW
jgi:glycosyltransferase involved in cell wall biosynthesis